MATFDLGQDFTASYTRARHSSGYGYVAKGTIFLRGNPLETFEGVGISIPAAEQAAWLKAHEIWKRLVIAELKAEKDRAMKGLHRSQKKTPGQSLERHGPGAGKWVGRKTDAMRTRYCRGTFLTPAPQTRQT